MDLPYEQLRALCLQAMAKLARQGFVAAPQDALDLIHDFIADPWASARAKYDPSKGTLEALAYVAFARFARRRILGEHRARRSLADLAADETSRADPSPFSTMERIAVLEALERMKRSDRELLQAYFAPEGVSERDLARRRRVSRHEVRVALVEALARLTAALERPSGIAEPDWRALRAVWVDGYTIDEAAAGLRMTVPQVEGALGRVRRYFSENLPTNTASRRKRSPGPRARGEHDPRP
jgi:RNA polymerase sigma factor (sigma-70 family)